MLPVAPPDGQMLLLTDVGGLSINNSLFTNLQFSVPGDFAPVAMVGYSPHVLVAGKSLPVKNLAELLAHTRKNPGQVNFAAASGIGGAPQLAGVLLAEQAKMSWSYVPYKGGSQAITDLIGGQVDVSMIAYTATVQHIKAGTLKALGVSSKARMPQLPDVPAIAETMPGFLTGTWQGLLASKDTPKPVVDRLAGELAAILKTPEMQRRFEELGMQTVDQSPAQFSAWLREQVTQWEQVIKRNNVRVE